MKLLLDSRLYRVTAVREAAGEFAELADIRVVRVGQKLEVDMRQMDPELADILPDEFLNFALAGTIAGRG